MEKIVSRWPLLRLTNAPATFKRMMDVVLAGLNWNTCLVYLYNTVISSSSVSQQLARLK